MHGEETSDDRTFPDKFLRSYMKGDIIFEEGSIGSHMYVISKGTVPSVIPWRISMWTFIFTTALL